jgi:cytochrome P450
VSEETGGFRFTPETAAAQGMLLMFAGLEPTRYLIGNAIRLLLAYPDQRDLLQANPALIPQAVEEFLRHSTPVQYIGRTAACSFTYKGNRIEQGQVVLLVVASANRDSTVFTDPDILNLARPANRHLSFGQGPHACIGAHLVRLQTTIALQTILTRFPRLTLREGAAPVWNNNLGFHGPASLLVSTGLQEDAR